MAVPLFMLEKELSNFIITVINGPGVWKFPVHTYYLKKHSPVFKAMLENEFLETQERELIIRDFTGIHVQQFLKCLYFETLPLQLEDVLEVLKIADKYQVTSVLEQCNNHLVQKLKLDNVFQLLEVSDKHSFKALKEKCRDLLLNIAFFFLETENFVNLAQSHVKELLSADNLNVVNEMQVFRAALRWLKFNEHWVDISSRSELLNLVRWKLIKESDYLQVMGKDSLPEDVVIDVKCSLRVHKGISLVPFSKSLSFDDYASPATQYLSRNTKITGLKLVSLEPSTVFINGFQVDTQCGQTMDHNVTIYDHDSKEMEVIQLQRKNSKTFLMKPYALEKGCYFVYTFHSCNDQKPYPPCNYLIPLEKSCKRGDFKFICEGTVILVKKVYYMKT